MNIAVKLSLAAFLAYCGSTVASPRVLPDPVPRGVPEGLVRPGKGASGLREVYLAIDAVTNLTAVERRKLHAIAGSALKRSGSLPLSKRKVAFQQTRRCLAALASQANGGGKEGAKLVEETFAYDFGMFVKSPAVTWQQRRAAAAMFQEGYAAIEALIDRTFTDTPPAIRTRIVAATGKILEGDFRNVCNYYFPPLLYPDRRIPSMHALYRALARDSFVALNPKAFSTTAVMLGTKGISKKAQSGLVQEFITQEANSEAFSVQSILQRKFFNGPQWKALPPGMYGALPVALQREWNALQARLARRWRRKYQEQTDSSVNGGLYPIGKQILKGSGVKE